MPERFAVPSTRLFWLGLLTLLLGLGIFLRFYHLDYKVYWIDEVNTTLRSLGYTSTEVQQTLLTGEPFTAADLQAFQQPSPDHSWDDTWQALRGAAEHTPLYFLVSRWWVERFGSTIAVWRSVATIFSLLTLPAVFWWCRELFQKPLPGWLAIALIAVSPLHVLYAQEARPYSLLTLITALSSASLLRAMGTRRWSAWILYGLTIALGLYSQLLFGLVAIAHALYVLILERGWTPTVRRYSLVMAGAIAAFSPWLLLLATNLTTVQRKTATLREERSIGRLIDGWFRVVNQMTVDWELAGWNVLLVMGAIAAVVILIRHAPRRAWLLLVLVGGVSFLGLALPDLVLGGGRSLRVRYLFPAALCLHIAIAYSFSLAIPAKTLGKRLSQGLLALLLAVQLLSCTTTAQETAWWNKSRPRSTYYPSIATILNADPDPWVLTQGKVSDLLALSYWLRPDLFLQAVPSPENVDLDAGNHTLYLLYGSSEAQTALANQGYQLTPLDLSVDAEPSPLWQLQPLRF